MRMNCGTKNSRVITAVILIVAVLSVLIAVKKRYDEFVDHVKSANKEIKVAFCGDFDPQDYEWGMTTFPSDLQVASISDADTAAEIAEGIWRKRWGWDANPGDITEVYYDEETGYWLVKGTVPQEWFDNWTLGVIPCAIFHESGDAIAIWKD